MPLLKKRVFERAPIPEDIRDNEEVFYCAATNEIFRDYEDFSERLFLCNSMIWTCSLTGKSNLTYAEALESEENARKSLEDFPAELKLPILYLVTLMRKSGFGDLVEDVFLYAKDRYFIGENVEVNFTGSKWKDAHVLQVISPSEDKTKSPLINGQKNPPGNLYKYEIEHLDADDRDISEIMIVDSNQIRRKKGNFSFEKCKIFLKQCLEQSDKAFYVVKPSIVEAFHLNKLSFESIFNGPGPIFEASKKLEKTFNGKKVRQESLHKFLTKNGENNNSELLEKMKRKDAELKLQKQQKKEMEVELKRKKKEENDLLAKYVKNFYKPKEDLELVDNQKLPNGNAVKLKIPDEHLGDVFMVLEFVHDFSEYLVTKDFFPAGLTVDLMERALTEHEVAGPLVDLIHMLLTGIFTAQIEEAAQYKTDAFENPANVRLDEISNHSLLETMRSSTKAASWSKKHQGFSLCNLPLYSLTTSEVLRLHLVSSGAVVNNLGARWRYQQRGGYRSEDDPGLSLILNSPHIVKQLQTHHVVELEMSDKLKIVTCLVNQLLTYADVRDIVEERIEKLKQARLDYKNCTNTEKRREQEFATAKSKLKKMDAADAKVASDLRKLEEEAEKKKGDHDYEVENLRKIIVEKQIHMGQDRAFRKYLKLESVPGFLMNFEEDNPGTCLNNLVEQVPELINASHKDIVQYLKKTMFNKSSPKKSTLNGLAPPKREQLQDLSMCTSNGEDCLIHSSNLEKNKWFFYSDCATFQNLLSSLNKRGLRESELLSNLKNNMDEIEKVIVETPIHTLNSEFEEDERRVKKPLKAKYENANMGYPNDMSPTDVLHNSLIENVLEMEEKLTAGNLGNFLIKNREQWRNCLQNKNYKDLDKTLPKREEEISETYEDPGQFLDIDNNEIVSSEPVRCLAIALSQIARSVHSKFLKKPLGRIGINRYDKKAENTLIFWEQSLLASTSFSQVFLHYSTLDSCIMWGKSALLTSCRVCRRRNDSENMLLCHSCKLGHHLYCLKPKLKSMPCGDWFCPKCKKEQTPDETPKKRKRPIFRDEEIEESEASEANETSSTEDEDELGVHLCKTCGSGGEVISCEKCSSYFHIECVEPPLRRAPRGPWSCNSCKNKRHSSSDEEVYKRTSRRDEGRTDLPLHNSALHAVLAEIMKDYNAWPFLRPVQKTEVPDYYEVIEKPMDFGTIKYKLNMGEYHEDSQFMADALLVFQNCNTYNSTEDDVYRCGVDLLKHFQKKCREVGLKLPEELDYESRPRKKVRTK